MVVKQGINYFSRFFIGGLLIFSGLVKLNDPIGTEIKLEEYFEVFSESFGTFFQNFIPWALEIGMFMIVLEIVLGIAILIHWRMNLTMTIALLMMLFFTFLTFYSAYYNKVTDCGCFGDFIKLTPWQSFGKDVVLDVFIIYLFLKRRDYLPALPKWENGIVALAVVISIWGGVYAIRHLPYFDFRPYKIGNNIRQQMEPLGKPAFEYIFEKDGKKVSAGKFLPAQEGYKYLSSRVTNADAIKPPITDFAVLTPTGDNLTEQMFVGNKLFIISSDIKKADAKNMSALQKLINGLQHQNVEPIILTASSESETEAFRHEHQLAAPIYLSDATVLKTIIRANPGITLWKNGVVAGKWHHNNTPAPEQILAQIK